jgi:hypothetical protein
VHCEDTEFMGWTFTAILGLTLMAASGFLATREHLWLKSASVTDGKVVELIRTRGSKGRSSYRPRVSFVAQNGTTHDFVRGYSSNPPGCRVGDPVLVAYDPRTYEGRILTSGQRFGLTAALGAVGLASTVLAVVFMVGRELVPRIYLH